MRTAIILASLAIATAARSEPVRIVSWNMGPSLEERLALRAPDIQAMNEELAPDVLVLVEVVGRRGAQQVAEHLGWPDYHVAVSDLSIPSSAAHEGIEVAVVSKIPMIAVSEMDVTPDQRSHDVFGTHGPLSVVEKLLTSAGIAGVQQTGARDRGTLRVDLANGLTIFPVHLKSNLNNACADATTAQKALTNMMIDVPPALSAGIASGFQRQIADDLRNAAERERVIAAIKREADKAVAEGRTVVIAGDFNTSFEAGKSGSSFADCALQGMACKKQPFPATACAVGDGFDDSFAILTQPLVDKTRFAILTEGIGRTYEEMDFGDAAIDHIAVAETAVDKFSAPAIECSQQNIGGVSTKWAAKSCTLFGSDHYPVATDFLAP